MIIMTVTLIKFFHVSDANGQNTRLIAIPSFQKSQTVAILNLKTLECNAMSFSTGAHLGADGIDEE